MSQKEFKRRTGKSYKTVLEESYYDLEYSPELATRETVRLSDFLFRAERSVLPTAHHLGHPISGLCSLGSVPSIQGLRRVHFLLRAHRVYRICVLERVLGLYGESDARHSLASSAINFLRDTQTHLYDV